MLSRRAHDGLASWFMQEVRSTNYNIHWSDVEVPPITCTRGIPQGYVGSERCSGPWEHVPHVPNVPHVPHNVPNSREDFDDFWILLIFE